jgi:hypothetical protein
MWILHGPFLLHFCGQTNRAKGRESLERLVAIVDRGPNTLIVYQQVQITLSTCSELSLLNNCASLKLETNLSLFLMLIRPTSKSAEPVECRSIYPDPSGA